MINYDVGSAINGFSPEEREKIINEFMPKIKSWVIRMSASLPDSVDLDDLFSSACVGLIESMDRFDKDRNVNFYSFAERRIKGSILDTLRSLDFLPRNVRTRLKQLESYIEKTYRESGIRPSAEEIAAKGEFDEKEVYRLLELQDNDKLLSLDEAVGTEGENSLIDFIKSAGLTPEDEAVKNRLIARLAEEIDDLPEKERYSVILYYYEELTMKEIAEVLDVTESRVSQIHTAAVNKLKRRLKDFYE